MSSFGKRLEIKRKEKRLSQDELAKLMNKSHRTVVSSWEKDKSEPSLSDIRKLAELLDTTIAYLADGQEANPLTIQPPPAGFILKSAEAELKEKEEKLELQRELLEYQRKVIKAKEAELDVQKS